MKKHIIKILIVLSAFSFSLSAQQKTACTYSTCVPAIPFNNTDLLQIYGVIKSSGSSGGTSSVIVTSGTVTGNFGGYRTKITSTVSTDGAYTVNDCVGTIQTMSNCFRAGQTTGVLQDLEIWDRYAQNAVLTIDLWSSTPAGGTFSNNAPYVLSSSDALYYLGSVSVASSDYVITGSVSRACITGINLTINATAASRNVFYTINTGSAPTYGVAGTLNLSFGILQD